MVTRKRVSPLLTLLCSATCAAAAAAFAPSDCYNRGTNESTCTASAGAAVCVFDRHTESCHPDFLANASLPALPSCEQLPRDACAPSCFAGPTGCVRNLLAFYCNTVDDGAPCDESLCNATTTAGGSSRNSTCVPIITPDACAAVRRGPLMQHECNSLPLCEFILDDTECRLTGLSAAVVAAGNRRAGVEEPAPTQGPTEAPAGEPSGLSAGYIVFAVIVGAIMLSCVAAGVAQSFGLCDVAEGQEGGGGGVGAAADDEAYVSLAPQQQHQEAML